jgi:hypothetical protein
MTVPNLLSATPYHPASFQERGVAVPFTTPFLGGARARPRGDHGIDLLVRNPTGGRGVYVMPWTGVATLCRPTLHDKVLNTRIAALNQVTPATIRQVARAIAAEGLAGEQAMQAAQIATATGISDHRTTNHYLLTTLVHQVNALLPLSSTAGGQDLSDLDTRARLTIAWLAPHLRQSPIWAIEALAALTHIMAGVGVAGGGEAGRVPRLTSMLRQVRDAIAAWGASQRGEDRVACSDTICAMADATLALVETAQVKARGLTRDMVGLLRSWAADPDSVIRFASRPEWLLDGWEQICLIWNYAQDDAARFAALIEILDHVPVLPTETIESGGGAPDLNHLLLRQRPLGLNEDWRTGAAVFDLIARNEQLRAVAS